MSDQLEFPVFEFAHIFLDVLFKKWLLFFEISFGLRKNN